MNIHNVSGASCQYAAPTLKEFMKRVEAADWEYPFSDEHKMVLKGRLEISNLQQMAEKHGDEFVRAFKEVEERRSCFK